MHSKRSRNPVGRSLAAALLFALALPPAEGAEDFAGRLAGWKDLREDYGARGDGTTDDTAPIQLALDDLRLHETHCVLFIPAGTYRVTKTVRTERQAHTDCMGIAIIGENPATTKLLWDGPEDGTLLQLDAWYSKISRLTLDGRNKAAVALAWGDHFSTYNETSDMVFQDAKTGILFGTGEHGQAENAVLRCCFLRCEKAGVLTSNFNSLDVWIWHSVFEDCGHGAFNAAGNFHVYESVFLRSRIADIGAQNLMVFSFVNNMSIRSKAFVDLQSGHTWGSPTTISGNRIVEPEDFAIRLGNGGPYLLLDNEIRSRPGKTTPEVILTWGDQSLVGNTYTIESAVQESGRFRRIAERTLPATEIDPEPPTLPPTPALRRRPVIELPPSATTQDIQQAIDRAQDSRGQAPVVHLQKGTYRIDRSLHIPEDADLVLQGDGAAETATVLVWSGDGEGPLLDVRGPSRATIRDLSIQAGHATGIRIHGCDQPKTRILADQLNVSGQNTQEDGAGIHIRKIEHAEVLLRCLQGGAFARRWIDVEGSQRVTVLAGATGTATRQYHVSKGGRLLVRSVYHERSGAEPQAIVLDGEGTLTIDATRFSYATAPEAPLIETRGFRGRLTLTSSLLLPVGTEEPATIAIGGDGSRTELLALGNLFWAPCARIDSDRVWKNASDPGAQAALLLSNLNGGEESKLPSGFGRLENRGEAPDDFILKMLEPLRAQSRAPAPGQPPPTSVMLHRVIATAGRGGTCVAIEPTEEPREPAR